MNATTAPRPRPAQRAPRPGLMGVIVAWSPLIVVSAAIFWFSSQPNLGKANLVQAILSSLFGSFPWYAYLHSSVAALNAASSWLAHLAEFAILALACLWAVTRQWSRLARPFLLAFAYAALFALSDEFHQSFVPGRHSDWRDVLTDWVGAAIAVGAVMLYRRRRARPKGLPAPGTSKRLPDLETGSPPGDVLG